MTANLIDRVAGLSEGLAVKAPVRAATIANITLAGLQTIDGIALSEGDAVLVCQQTTASENGVYLASSGNWIRRSDFDGQRDIVKGTHVFVTDGVTQSGFQFYVSTAPAVIGSDSIEFLQEVAHVLAGAATATSWNTLYAYGTHNTPIQSVSATGEVAIYGAARASDTNSTGAVAAGVMGWAFNDNTSVSKYVWASYFEARKYAGGGGAHGQEVNISNFGSLVNLGPYNAYLAGATIAHSIASGGNTASVPAYNPATGLSNLTASTASAAVRIVANGSDHDVGVLFGKNSLHGADGTVGGGYGKAIVLAQHHDIEWWRDNSGIGIVAGRIRSSTSVASGEINFVDSAVEIRDLTDAATWLRVEGSASTVNGIRIVPGATGSAAAIDTYGPDTNINLVIAPKGAGILFTTAFFQASGGMQSGGNGGQTGYLGLAGLTSGTVYIKAQDAAGSYNFNLPTTPGTAGQLLTSAGGVAAPMTWTGVSGSSGSVLLAVSPTTTGTFTADDINITSGHALKNNGTQVVGARDTGWGAMTGTPDKATAFATSTVTLAQLAGRVMAMQTALTTHGLLGA